VEESVQALVLRKLQDRMATIRVGDPLDKNTDMGAINSKMQLERIRSMVAAGEEEGAIRFSASCTLPEKGYWFAPTIFTGATQAHRIAREEVFGPVLTVMSFRTPEEAVEKANNSMYGLSAGVWTDKGAKIFHMAQKLKAGVIWGDTFNRFDPTSPFGGYKESGFGREGGRQGLSAYVEVL
jgi:aldehyde dehydrogenase (NAD+)